MRLRDESDMIREAFPTEYTDAAVFVTDLASTSILMFLLAVLFWVVSRHDTALVISYAFAGVAFILLVKTVLGLSRPPEELFLVALEDDPYGFPSGHAFAAVLVYGGLLKTYDLTRERVALLGVAVLVVLISLSRIVLGFHYISDVIVGATLGVAFILAMDRITAADPRRGFAIAIVLSIPAVAITGAGQDSLLGLGGAIGGLVGSTQLEDLPALRSRLEGGLLAAVGVGFIVGMTALESMVVEAFEPGLIGLYAVLMAGILLAPSAISRLEVGPLGDSTPAGS